MEIFTKGPRTHARTHAHDDADLVYPVMTFFGIEFLVSKTYLGGKKNILDHYDAVFVGPI